MIKLKQGMVKVSKKIVGALVDNGCLESDRKYDMVEITAPEAQDKIHNLVEDALSGLVDQIADFAETNGKDGAFVRQAMLNNINAFRLDAGSGYSDARKVQLVEEGKVGSLEDFLPPNTTTASAPAEEVVGGLDF